MSRASANDPITRGYIEAEEKAERLRRSARLKQYHMEMQEREGLQKAEEEHLKRQRAVQREAALADALGRKKIAELREEKEVQRIREEAPELRALRQKLAAAQMNQQREMQLVQKKEQDLQDKQMEQTLAQEMEQVRMKAQKQDDDREAKRKENWKISADVLQQQMEERDMAKVAAYQEFLREKHMVDEIVRKIEEEDKNEQIERMNKQRQTREYIAEYLRDRERVKAEDKARQEEEDRQILAFMAEQNRRKEDQSAKTRQKMREQELLLQTQSEAIAEERRKKEEMEDILIEYYQELKEEKDREAEQARIEKRLRDRVAMIEANEYQKQIKAAKVEGERKEEENFRRMMMDKFAEDDRLEQMNAMKRNQRRAEHNREVQRLIDEKRAMREAERQREMEDIATEREREDRRRAIIEQERQRLLEEHATKLAAYLPKGVLQEDDIARLGLDPATTGTATSLPKF
jgi:hypothetical protein|mmetsp:Transcript_76726/g.128952  ORF Transcript_76726/g.128952 Transcript_76726/m.128952 type:complete len:463 (-) Transcript_76726:320-1708(-)|eukprot:CAMPEP_0174302112 /NCGR_PEP_ID=MMETSP0809-20121228/59444_1 /TAXON_ID=73025 ORGANISM="Eutreptiella gymnastica-like, Strain CCMP1594" /NCGR_SAMPLE_ID=MMETSP0809 /ASSEMBLY_ACC=CAM_ASM_000658 /LENGTH=462 /DNA_ID=CAMNT_0015407983 /DNA_START=99 /DNA_END=1487 /DNA_ORIENTATION=-